MHVLRWLQKYKPFPHKLRNKAKETRRLFIHSFSNRESTSVIPKLSLCLCCCAKPTMEMSPHSNSGTDCRREPLLDSENGVAPNRAWRLDINEFRIPDQNSGGNGDNGCRPFSNIRRLYTPSKSFRVYKTQTRIQVHSLFSYQWF